MPPKNVTGGGGGYFHNVCILGMCRKRDPPFSALNFPSGAYHFHKFPKNPFRSITILHFLADFAVPLTIIFKFSLISTRSSPPTAGSARTQRRGLARRVLAVPESPNFTLKRIKLVPEPPPPPPFSSSKRLKLVPQPPIFTLDRELVPEPLPIFHFAAAHTYQNLG